MEETYLDLLFKSFHFWDNEATIWYQNIVTILGDVFNGIEIIWQRCRQPYRKKEPISMAYPNSIKKHSYDAHHMNCYVNN